MRHRGGGERASGPVCLDSESGGAMFTIQSRNRHRAIPVPGDGEFFLFWFFGPRAGADDRCEWDDFSRTR